MESLVNDLKKWGVDGFNNHEMVAFDVGYINKYFNNYLILKKKLLQNADKASTIELKRFYNALTIYVYSIFENIWYGYIISHSKHVELKFTFDQVLPVKFINPYQTHLPSFSSAILHFGTCRDLFSVLLKLCIEPTLVNNSQGIGKLLRIHYKKNEFKKDLEKLTNKKDSKYINNGLQFYDDKEFRNFYAHRMRLVWWINKNGKSKNRYLFKKNIYRAIKENNRQLYEQYILDILNDPKSYREFIEYSHPDELIGSEEILKEKHDMIAEFMNASFKFIKQYDSVNI